MMKLLQHQTLQWEGVEMKFDFVLGEVEDRLEEIDKKLTKTNELLAKIEENLRVPNLVEWAKFRNSLTKITSD